MNMNCSIEGCEKPVQARGWCSAHWARWKRHGDPLGGRNTLTISAGQRYGRLEVISQGQTRPGGELRWNCRCDCGNETLVGAQALREGVTNSCGCLIVEASQGRVKHGYGRDGKKSPEYLAWVNLRARCRNPNNPQYADYGGRGITVDPRWDDFAQFLSDMGERPTRMHSIDRVDNEGNYSPENCEWRTVKEQHSNRRELGHNGSKNLPDYIDDCLLFLERHVDSMTDDQRKRLKELDMYESTNDRMST
jgi:hypothetical protein